MNDIDFERRLAEDLTRYAGRPVDSGAAWRRLAQRQRQRQEAAGRVRRLVTVTVVGAVAVAAIAVPYALRPDRGGG
jgi:hypothetical protein